MKDKIILTVKGLNQAIYTLRNKGYSNENICIYLTKETIIEYAKTMPTNSSIIFGILYSLCGVVCSIFIDKITGISYLLFGIGLLIAWTI